METRGIFSKGYGIVPKLVMLEGGISIDAKALYAYFCAYAGKGSSCYPPRDKILNDLGFSPSTYYAYLGELRNGGYIDIKKHKTKAQAWCNNRILLMQTPPIAAKAAQQRRRFSLTGSLRDSGFGRIPLAAMTDRRLSRRAKALYAYFCSFAGNRAVCTPEVDFTLSFLNICLNSYYKYLNELLVFNYITVFHRKDAKGRYTSNSIMLNDAPDHVSGLLELEERRERYLHRVENGGSTKPEKRYRRKHKPIIQNPKQLTDTLRKQVSFSELQKSYPEKQLNMIIGFMTELSFDPYSPIETAAVTGADIKSFIEQTKQSIRPDMIIRNYVSYWKRCFINFVMDKQLAENAG